jgi:PleD family two-component response regulator
MTLPERSDDALYQAKAQGRNRVVISPSETIKTAI